MVRINLLPERKVARKGAAGLSAPQGGQTWLIVGFGIILLEIVGLVFVQNLVQNKLAAVTSENQKIQTEIDSIKGKIADRGQVQADLKQCRDRDQAVQKLQAARTGPTSALLELTRVLTQGRGPTTDRDRLEQMKRDNPSAVMNPNWDTRRLWLVTYTEIDRVVKVSGFARDGLDVSEFERRLALSDYFSEVKLLQATKITDNQTKEELLKFDLTAKVRY